MTNPLYIAQGADPFSVEPVAQHQTGRIVYAPNYGGAGASLVPGVDQNRCRNSDIGMESSICAVDVVVPMAGVTLTLPYPISANRYWAYRTVKPRGKPEFVSMYVTKEAKEYKAQVEKLAKVHGIRAPIAGRVALELTLYPNRPQDWKTRQRKMGAAWDDTVQCLDLDNAQKVVLDSLKDIVFQDDAWVREIHARRAEPDEFGARLMVKVVPLAVEQPQGALL